MQKDPRQTPVSCPRCGYDLRGEVDRWTTDCPLEGVCTECGLGLRWAEILVPGKFAPTWSIEYAAGLTGTLRAFFGTVLRSLRPLRFWATMRMSHAVRRRRLALYAALLVALPVLLLWLQCGIAGASYRFRLARNPAITSVSYTYPEAIFDAMFRPLASSTSGVYFVGTGQAIPYPPPREMFLSLSWMTRGAGNASEESLLNIVLLGVCLVVLAIFPVTFVLLPVSRRRAKVRWIHVWRVAIYSLVIPSLAACGFVTALALRVIFPVQLDPALVVSRWLMMTVPVPALIVWWASAIGRYLRLPHGPAVALLLGLIAVLLVPLVLAGGVVLFGP